MRLMAIDYGEKRVGIASTDETGRFALPRAVWPNDTSLIKRISEFKDKENIERIILGESLDFSGKANLVQEKISCLKQELESLGMQVTLHPEIFTSAEARQIQGKTEMLDASAAALILKSFIDTVYNREA